MGETEQHVGDVVVRGSVDGRAGVTAGRGQRLGVLASFLQRVDGPESMNTTGFDVSRGKVRLGDQSLVARIQRRRSSRAEIATRCPVVVPQLVDPQAAELLVRSRVALADPGGRREGRPSPAKRLFGLG